MKVNLVKLQAKHIPLFYKWWTDPELIRLTSDRKEKLSKEKIKKMLLKKLAASNRKDFIITVEKKPIGHIAIMKNKNHKYFEYYIAIGEKKYWGKGLGTIATKKAVKWFFKNFPKENLLELEVRKSNSRALRSYEKAGFRFFRKKPFKLFPDLILMRVYKK